MIIRIGFFALYLISFTLEQSQFNHFIIQGTFPEGCGHSYLSKRTIFNSIRHSLLTTTQCDCFKNKIDFYLGQLEKNIEIINLNEENGFETEFNIKLFVKEQSSNAYTQKLIGTSLKDSNHFYDCLYDNENEDKLLKGIIKEVCNYCDPQSK